MNKLIIEVPILLCMSIRPRESFDKKYSYFMGIEEVGGSNNYQREAILLQDITHA